MFLSNIANRNTDKQISIDPPQPYVNGTSPIEISIPPSINSNISNDPKALSPSISAPVSVEYTAETNVTTRKIVSKWSAAYHAARRDAEIYARKRLDLFTESSKAYREGRVEEAKKFSEEGRKYGELMRAANEMAVNEVLVPQKLSSSSTIDLHGLLVEEAVNATRNFVEISRGRNEIIDVFTGPNLQLNSTARISIKPAIIELCAKEGWSWIDNPSKQGCLSIRLPSS